MAVRVACALFGVLLTAFMASAQPVPVRVPRVGVLWAGPLDFAQPYVAAGREALRELGWVEGQNIAIEYRFEPAGTTTSAEILPAFASMTQERAEGLVVVTDPLTWVTRRQIIEQAAKSRVPAVYELREYVDAGGAASYGPSLITLIRRVAIFVDKILKGPSRRPCPSSSRPSSSWC